MNRTRDMIDLLKCGSLGVFSEKKKAALGGMETVEKSAAKELRQNLLSLALISNFPRLPCYIRLLLSGLVAGRDSGGVKFFIPEIFKLWLVAKFEAGYQACTTVSLRHICCHLNIEEGKF